MNISCLGIGAVSSYVGAILLDAGHRVNWYVRERQRREQAGFLMRRSVTIADQELPIPAELIRDIHDLGDSTDETDILVFGVKSYHTEEAVATLSPLSPRIAAVLAIQNGVGNEVALERVFGAEKLIWSSLTTSLESNDYGIVRACNRGGIGLSSSHCLQDSLCAAFQEKGIPTKVYDDCSRMKWSKLCGNLVANALCALLRITPNTVVTDADLFTLEVRQLREAFSVMRALGIEPIGLPGVPVRLLRFIVSLFSASICQFVMTRSIIAGRGNKPPSMLSDLWSKGTTEVEVLNGAVVKFGAQCGIATPVNTALTNGIRAIERCWLNAAPQPHAKNDLLAEVDVTLERKRRQ